MYSLIIILVYVAAVLILIINEIYFVLHYSLDFLFTFNKKQLLSSKKIK